MTSKRKFVIFNVTASLFLLAEIASLVSHGSVFSQWLYLLDISLYLGLAYRIYRRDLAPSKRKEIE